MATNDDLHDFVREALTRGSRRGDIEAALVGSGWSAAQTRAALAEFAETDFPIPVPRPRPSLDARDAFVYLVLFSTLYLSAFSLGNLTFDVINGLYPDPAFGPQGPWVIESIRWSIASLIVGVPVFLFVSGRARRAIARDPARRGSKVRRWLTYLTLALTSTVLIGDVIALVLNVLGGELSMRFVLKAATVAIIGGGAFLYYLWDVKADEGEASARATSARRTAGGLVALATTAAVVGGFWLVGSPAHARMQRLDDRREADLRRLTSDIDLYWSRKKVLPSTLEQARTEAGGGAVAKDPITGAPYRYRVLSDTRYELCATFERASDENPHGLTDGIGSHQAGPHCFTQEVRSINR